MLMLLVVPVAFLAALGTAIWLLGGLGKAIWQDLHGH